MHSPLTPTPAEPGALLTNLARQVPGVIYQFLMRPDGTSCFPFASDAVRQIYEVEPDAIGTGEITLPGCSMYRYS